MRLLISFIIVLLLSFSFSSAAILYKPTMTVTEDEFSVTDKLSGTSKDFVYELAPSNYKIVTVTLSGPPALLPKLYIYDPVAQTFVFQENALSGEVVTFTYTNGMSGDKPQSMYAVVVDYPGAEDQDFTLTVVAKEQNDAASGTDASKRFRDGLLVTPGAYAGHLSGGDTVDYYVLNLQQDETASFTITPKEKTSLHFTLIDSSGFTKVNTRSLLNDENLKAQYLSLKDQRVYFGIEGNVPYTLVIESDKKQAADEGVADVPQPIIVLPEPEQNPPVVVDEAVVDDRPSLGLFFMIAALLVLVMLGVGALIKSKHSEKKVKGKAEKPADKPKKEKSSGKDETPSGEKK